MATELKFDQEKQIEPACIDYEILHMNVRKAEEYIFDPKTSTYRLPYDSKTGVYKIPPQTEVLFHTGDDFYLVKDSGSRTNIYYGQEAPVLDEQGDWILPKIKQLLPLDHHGQKNQIGQIQAGLYLKTVYLSRILPYNPPPGGVMRGKFVGKL